MEIHRTWIDLGKVSTRADDETQRGGGHSAAAVVDRSSRMLGRAWSYGCEADAAK